MTGFIYVIRCLDRVKIGFSLDPHRRMSKISSDAPYPCVLAKIFPGTKESEADLHSQFAEYREHGEWFRDEGDVRAFAGDVVEAKSPRRYSNGKAAPKTYGHSVLRGLASKHGDLSRWSKAMGLPASRLSGWSQVPSHHVARLAEVSGIPASVLRPDLFEREAA